MATLYLTEYRFIANVPLDVNYTPVPGQAPQEPSVADQTVAIGIGPTATTSMKRLAANQTEYFGVAPSQQLSVIQNV